MCIYLSVWCLYFWFCFMQLVCSFMRGFLYGLSVVVYVMDACLYVYLCISLYTYLSVCACACLCVRMFIHGLLTSCKVMHFKQWKQHTFINSWCTKLISEICIKGKMSSGKKTEMNKKINKKKDEWKRPTHKNWAPRRGSCQRVAKPMPLLTADGELSVCVIALFCVPFICNGF